MPTYEYSCEKCEILFEETLLQSNDIKQYAEWYPCPKCGKRAIREKVSITNFSFKAPPGRTAGTGVHGQSGVHDLDYPKLDKAVGRSSVVKWQKYDIRKAERDKVRKESGSNSISISPDGKARPTSPEVVKIREQAYSTFQKSKKPEK